MRRSVLLVLIGLVAALTPATSTPASTTSDFEHLVGGLHTHTGYSDGVPGTTPADAYARARDVEGLDFMAVTEHSEALRSPTTLSEGCLEGAEAFVGCSMADPDPFNSADKWDAQRRQASFASRPGEYVAMRGFEWTSDSLGHINVYFSRNFATRLEGGEATTETFYSWLRTPAWQGGGDDGLAVFNHPGDKDLHAEDPRRNWDSFAYVPDLDDRFVGIEIFNRGRARYEDEAIEALDRGWHLGFVGAEDIHEDDWGSDRNAKSVILAEDLSPASLKEAMAARRMYAVLDRDVRIEFDAGGEPMGSRIVRPEDEAPVTISASVEGGDVSRLVLVSNRGVEVSSSTSTSISFDAPLYGGEERYYFLKVEGPSGDPIAYSSPVWITGEGAAIVCPQLPIAGDCKNTIYRPEAPFEPRWVAGDLHVHTTWSHDSYGGPHDHNTDEDEFYVAGWTPGEQISIAESRDLDYLALTDHNNTLSVLDPAWTSGSVTLVPAYEKSLSGHIQMLGAASCYTDTGATGLADECPRSNDPSHIRSMVDALRTDGGVFQINHPSDGDWLGRFGDGSAADPIVPDTVEVWNIGPWHWQPPMPSANDNDFSLRFWETYLNAGHRVAATGGSDNHWRSTTAAQGAGQPTTWVYATSPGAQGILDALRAGRTTISHAPPAYGGARILLEADADGDGTYEAMIGDTVTAGAPMRVRLEGAVPGGIVRIVHGDGTTNHTEVEVPADGVLELTVPDALWVRAELRRPDAQDVRNGVCDPIVGDEGTYCRNRLVVEALTSPLYIG